MTGSVQIARLFGIPVFVHWTFWLLFGYILYLGHSQNLAAGQTLWLGLLLLAMFVCVLMHEFGHALAARRYGVRTRDIILLPIGGVARLEHLPEKPIREFVVAIAGPLVNVAIALLLFPVFFFYHLPQMAEGGGLESESEVYGNYFFFLPAVMFLNIGLAVFNMLPAFPMDGGRILRALLAAWLGRPKATRIAAAVGQVIAAGMFGYGMWEGSYTTAFVGVFIFLAARRENRWVQAESLLDDFTVRDIARAEFTRLRLDDPVQVPLDLLLENGERQFLVFDDEGRLAGTLPDRMILEMGKQDGAAGKVGDFFIPGAVAVSPADTLRHVGEVMRRTGCKILPVAENGRLTGVVDSDALEKFLKG